MYATTPGTSGQHASNQCYYCVKKDVGEEKKNRSTTCYNEQLSYRKTFDNTSGIAIMLRHIIMVMYVPV